MLKTPRETYRNLKIPTSVFRALKAIKEADQLISGRSTTLIDIVSIGVKHLEDEHRRLRGVLDIPNGHRRTARLVKARR